MTAKSSTRQSSLCSSTPDIFLIFNQKKRENVVGVITIMLSSHLLQFNFLPSVLEMLNTPNDDDDCSDDDDDRWDTTGTRYEQTLIITGTWDAPRQQRTNTLALWFPRFASQYWRCGFESSKVLYKDFTDELKYILLLHHT